MRRIPILIGVALVLSLAVSCTVIPFRQEAVRENPNNDPMGFAARLRGTWNQESRTVNGKVMNDPPDGFLVVTDDGRMEDHVPKGSTWLSGTDIVGNQFYRIDSTENPVKIDHTGMADWSKLSLGICRLERDTLTVCWGETDKPRPTQFATGEVPGMGNVMFVYKRGESTIAWFGAV